jgi:hypothetical protein
MVISPEFTFELRVCQWAERHWPPTDTGGTGRGDKVLIARQLGTKHRRWDTIVIETDSQDLAHRARFGPDRLDSDLLHVVRNAPEEWAYYRDCLPDPGYPWRYVREAIHTADERGIIAIRRQGNRIEIRRKWVYPDWVHRVVAIENKPDLDASAASALFDQLHHDVALALADEVWIATRSTGATVEPALLEHLPVEVGILTVDSTRYEKVEENNESGTIDSGNRDRGAIDVSVAWHPRSLDSDSVGTHILESGSMETSENDLSAARFEYADPDWKATKRQEIAERAYERGWRSYIDTMRPDCRYFTLRQGDAAVLPWCTAKDRSQTSAECSRSCPSFEPEPPVWRTRGWPIEGGPGKGIKRLLDQQRERQR